MKRVLITGGTKGIGRGIAQAFVNDGYEVVATGVAEEEVLDATSHPRLKTIVLDVTDDRSIERCFSEFDALDSLINCAGIILRDGKEFEIDQFERVLDVNLMGTMRMCSRAYPMLQASSSASIVNIASVLSFVAGPAVPAYTASKGGVAQLTKSLANAWAPSIRVNAIAPGWIQTDLTRPLIEDELRSTTIVQRTPMKRWGTPDDIGGPAVFLCSDAARFVTGAVIPVDGGYISA